MHMTNRLVLTTLMAAAGACGGSDDKACDVAAQTGCDSGDVCAAVAGGQPTCFAPVYLEGKVIDLATGTGIGDARVVALDVNRAPVSRVAATAADGSYRLEVPAIRNADGTPQAAPVTLRADARGYQSFPSGLRDAIPLDVGGAIQG